MIIRTHRNVVVAGLVAVVFFALPRPTTAATTCKSGCTGTCTPGAPVAISTLIPSTAFPAGQGTPIAFVDPNDQRQRRLVATQQGSILVWDAVAGSFLATAFLDLRDDVGGPVNNGDSERGLLAMVADPDYLTNGRLYVYYTRFDGDIVVARYTRSAGNPDVGNVGSELVYLTIDHPAGNHNGGWLAFGPLDGFLYISTGDGGGGCDGNLGSGGDGQRNDTLLGKILRIDVRGIDMAGLPPDPACPTGANYTVPSTNPLVAVGGACDEVYLKGLRNPFRFSFDKLTGDLYVGDVGQDNQEEINLKRAATAAPVNFGWPCREGCAPSSNSPSSCSTTGCPTDAGTTCLFPGAPVNGSFYDPILCHSNPSGWSSMMGGYRYRGANVPSILGSYFYGDAGCGRIWKTTVLDPADPSAIDAACWASGFGGTYGFAEDHLGELYVVVGGAGRVSCVHNGAGCFWSSFAGFLADGFESGGFTPRWSGGTSP